MTAAKQHHYPAALVGQFGATVGKGKARERLVYMARRNLQSVVRVRAEELGVQRARSHLYDISLTGGIHTSIDSSWTYVENRIPELVATLRCYASDKGIARELFVRVLAPLIGQLMVRHPEFEERYRARTLSAGASYEHLARDGSGSAVNLARQVDLLCVCGILIDSQWWLLKSSQPFVGSDLGFGAAGIAFGGEEHFGYVFPMSPNIAIYVGNGTPTFTLDRDKVRLNVRVLTISEVFRTNELMAAWAPIAVFGHSEREVQRAIEVWASRTRDPPLRREIPGLLYSARAPQPPAQVEFWLRTLHSAQVLDEPENSDLVPFDECQQCQSLIANMLLWDASFAGTVEGLAKSSDGSD